VGEEVVLVIVSAKWTTHYVYHLILLVCMWRPAYPHPRLPCLSSNHVPPILISRNLIRTNRDRPPHKKADGSYTHPP
jgi:hypothetical protein